MKYIATIAMMFLLAGMCFAQIQPKGNAGSEYTDYIGIWTKDFKSSVLDPASNQNFTAKFWSSEPVNVTLYLAVSKWEQTVLGSDIITYKQFTWNFDSQGRPCRYETQICKLSPNASSKTVVGGEIKKLQTKLNGNTEYQVTITPAKMKEFIDQAKTDGIDFTGDYDFHWMVKARFPGKKKPSPPPQGSGLQKSKVAEKQKLWWLRSYFTVIPE